MTVISVLFIASLSVITCGEGTQRRFLFDDNLQQQVPEECYFLSDFVDVYDTITRWIHSGEYLYLKLLYIQAQSLRHQDLSDEEKYFLPTLTKHLENPTSDFAYACDDMVNVFHYGHEVCLALLQYGIYEALQPHQQELCQQLQRDDLSAYGNVCPATTKQTTIKTTAIKSTIKTTTPLTTQSPLICRTCNNTDCISTAPDVTCASNQICMVNVVDYPERRTVERGCVDITTCNEDQKKNSGFKSYCYQVDSGLFHFDFHCLFCCDQPHCNSGASLVPNRNSIYYAATVL